jgi:hypothetical protein
VRPQLTLYTRKDCCLCADMKEVIQRAAAGIPLDLNEIDVDSTPELRERFGSEVPVLFIAGRKAFKYTVTPRELKKAIEAVRLREASAKSP